MARSALSGTRIRSLRRARRIAQAELARMAGVSPSYLNLIEHNRRRAGPRLIEAIAAALQIPVEALDESAGDAQIDALRAAAAWVAGERAAQRSGQGAGQESGQGAAQRAAQESGRPGAPVGGLPGADMGGLPGPEPETDRIEEFVGRFPGWAALLARLSARVEGQEQVIERLSDRLAHDPNLSAGLLEIVSAVTSVQSTAAILAESEDLDPAWRARFHANVHADSMRLATAAEALVAFLDGASDTGGGLATPQEEVESWLARQGFHLPAIERPEPPCAAALIEGQAELASAPARALAAAWLARAHADAQALPLARLEPDLVAMFAPGSATGFDPGALAARHGVDLPRLFRRLACLPRIKGVPLFGLAVCDGSGTLTFRRPVEGFVPPRFGGACPLWPLYQAMVQPGRALAAVVEFASHPPARFVAHATAGAADPLRFAQPVAWQASMLLTPAGSIPQAAAGGRPGPMTAAATQRATGTATGAATGAASGESAVLGVGASCRICTRNGCPARREPSIVTG